MMDEARHGPTSEDSLQRRWREVLSAIDDRILRGCLPRLTQGISIDEERIVISVDSEFKKDYCQKKRAELSTTIAKVIGPREVVIGELPLLEHVHREEPDRTRKTRIAVLGIGDGGASAADRMLEEDLRGVEIIVVDTDKQVLERSRVHNVLQLGLDVTDGRGAGGNISRGQDAARESQWEISSLLEGMDLVFLAAGLGGGTGTGAAPVIAELARKSGALTVGIVTKPFSFEGVARRNRAEDGIDSLRKSADVLIVISNDNLLETAAKGMLMTKAFELADEVLHQGVRGISDLVTVRGLVNLDLADIRSVLANAGDAVMGIGEARGDVRAETAARIASTNPLLESESIRGARKMIMNVTGGKDLTLQEVTEAADQIRGVAATECDLVFGAVVDEDQDDRIKVTVIAADFQEGMKDERKRFIERERVAEGTDFNVPAFIRRQRHSQRKQKEDRE